ncbi:MAG TPA: ATP-binding cassette domain-containing protein [Solirubrobacteraceae bacterium]|nr:ATP-binding cassette domain-containing protein [Solirubrobacteraceae bacterium]
MKRYGEIHAVDDVDLTVEVGDIYGYLGPNGAGKTTTLRMLLGLIRRDGGSVSLFGRDPAHGIEALEHVAGFVESPTFYPYLSGRENLQLFGALDGGVERIRIDDVLDQVELTGRAGDRVGTYSLGMRQRLGIAAALLRDPKLLILDEPANGLDPAGIRDMRTLIASLPERGVTVLYSSHLLSEVEEVCNRVAIVRDGSIAFEGHLDELRASFGITYRLATIDDQAAGTVARGLGIHVWGEDAALSLDADRDLVDRLTIELGKRGIAIRELSQSRKSLEDLFFQLTEERA